MPVSATANSAILEIVRSGVDAIRPHKWDAPENVGADHANDGDLAAKLECPRRARRLSTPRSKRATVRNYSTLMAAARRQQLEVQHGNRKLARTHEAE